MTISCPKSVNGIALRITQTDACGKPVDVESVENSQVVTSGFVSLGIAPNIEAGSEITVKKADGTLCIARKQGDQLKWLDLTLELCGIPFPALSLLLGAVALTDESANIVGGALPSRDAQSGDGISPVQLEIWSINADSTACSGDSGEAYIQWVVPLARNFQLNGDITFSEDAANLTLVGLGEAAGGFESAVSNAWTQAQEESIAASGPLAWKTTDTIPDNIDDCAFVGAAS